MVEIKRIMCNPLQENCYVISDESKECVIIDCGVYYQDEKDALIAYIRDKQLTPTHLIATHGHLDHNFGNAFIYKEYGLKVEVCSEDEYLISDLGKQASSLFGMQLEEAQPEVGRWLKDGDTITFGHHELRVIQTPGHTPGSALLYCESDAQTSMVAHGNRWKIACEMWSANYQKKQSCFQVMVLKARLQMS